MWFRDQSEGKPDYGHSLNRGSEGFIPVVILATPFFVPADVDLDSH